MVVEEDGGGEIGGKSMEGMNRGLVGFCAFSPRVSWWTWDLVLNPQRLALGILHLRLALAFVMGRSGARNEEAGENQEGCQATLCIDMPRCNATLCVVVRCYRPWRVVKFWFPLRGYLWRKLSRPAGARPKRKFRGLVP